MRRVTDSEWHNKVLKKKSYLLEPLVQPFSGGSCAELAEIVKSVQDVQGMWVCRQ